MSEKQPAPDYLHTLYKSLRTLEPFLEGSHSLSEDAKCLADFMNLTVHVCRVALVWVDAHGNYKELGFWGEDSHNCEAIFQAFVRRNLAKFYEEFSHERNITDEQLQEIADASAGHPLPYSSTMFPIHCDGKIAGFAFFGKKHELGAWTQEEKNILIILITAISLSFSSRIHNEEYHMQSWVFNAMMDNMSANVYVTDIRTDKILFMNRTMKKSFGLTEPEGQICWKVLQKGMTHRCDFCPVHALQHNETEGNSCLWEEKNTKTGRIYENYDSLIPWMDGALVHFQRSIDVTESKRLTRAATMDDLTEMFNRRAGKKALREAIAQAKEAAEPLTVCMYDINILKEINDSYGHAEGDDLIVSVARAVKNGIGGRDFPFRMSGDEFVIVLRGCGEKEAAGRVEEIRRRLEEETRVLHKEYERGFCCGILEVSPYEDFTLEEVLSKVDEKMYEQKRRFHIDKADRERQTIAAAGALDESQVRFESQYLYDALEQSTEDYLYMCDMKTNTFRYAKAMVEEFGLPGEVIHNAAAVWGAKVHPDDKQSFLEANQDVFDGRVNSHSVEYRAKNRRGEWVWLRCRGHLQRDEMGEPSLFAGIISNLSKKKRIDHITGLYNKFEFEQRIDDRIQDHPRQAFGVLLLGLDEFKHINDLYDRAFGDEVLRLTAQRIQTLLPMNAAIYHLDGDEFGVVVTGAQEAGLQEIYQMLHREFSRQQEYNGKKYYCTLSAGGALYPRDAGSYLELSRSAGYSLEVAKSSGKNQLKMFSKDLLQHRERSLELTELLRESVENGFEGFSLHYQPQVCADTKRLKGAEALARWTCKPYGNVPPMEFIPLLEESGLIHPVGRWIFSQAVAACSKWRDKAPDFTMSINLSYLQLTQPEFLPFMEDTLKKYKVDPAQIIVELTESCIASSINALSESFQQIRGLHMKIAMDDFGTGYSSLEILKNCPADIVKISRAFVADIRKSNFDATFIRFIVALCHDVDIRVCLEGVENPEEYQTVEPMSLDYIQGYLFGRPMPAEDFEAYREPADV